MKRSIIITIALIAAIAVPLCASSGWARGLGVLGLGGGGAAVTPYCDGSELICEQFEGIGAPTGWDEQSLPYCDYDYATSPAPLAGQESLLLDGYASGSAIFTDYSVLVSGGDTISATFLFTPEVLSGTTATVFAFRVNNTNAAWVTIKSTMGVVANVSAGTNGAESATKLIAGETVRMKITYKKNTSLSVWLSINGGAYILASQATAGPMGEVNKVYLLASAGAKYIFDDLKVYYDEI